MKNSKIFPMVMMGVFAAVLAVLSQISIPLPTGMPVTLQTFAVALTGYALGWKRGLIATAVYVALGAVGLPVFAGFSGGLGAMLGFAGGYLWGFLPMAALCGLGLKGMHKPVAIAAGLAGLALCHLCGAAQYAVLAHVGLVEALLVASVPFLVKDVLSVAAAFAVSVMLRHSLKKGGVALDA